MWRDAGFTTFATLIAGLGIGASSNIFSVVNALLLVYWRSATGDFVLSGVFCVRIGKTSKAQFARCSSPVESSRRIALTDAAPGIC